MSPCGLTGNDVAVVGLSASLQTPVPEMSPYRAKNKPPAKPVVLIVTVQQAYAFTADAVRKRRFNRQKSIGLQ